jgi:hypothetical protein
MNMRNWSFFFVLVLVLAAVFPIRIATAQSNPDSLYFPQTGYTVKGEFLEKFQSATDPVLVYGYPITNDFIASDYSPLAGLRIQYFQKARFEYHMENAPGDHIVVSPLGSSLYDLEQIDSKPVAAASHPACRYFAETQHQTCYAFLKFFDANGGVEQFGNPISEIITLNGQLIQYFEKARFEWHPERPSGKRVTLTNLGQVYFNFYEKVPPPEETVVPKNSLVVKPEELPLELKVRSFAQNAVVAADGTQTIFVIVTDQKNRPVNSAQVTLTMTPAGEQPRYLAMPVTNSSGVTSVAVPIKDLPIGIVEVQVSVNYNSSLQKATVTSFRIWY